MAHANHAGAASTPTVHDAFFSTPEAAAASLASFREGEGATRPSIDYYSFLVERGIGPSDSEHPTILEWMRSPARP